MGVWVFHANGCIMGSGTSFDRNSIFIYKVIKNRGDIVSIVFSHDVLRIEEGQILLGVMQYYKKSDYIDISGVYTYELSFL